MFYHSLWQLTALKLCDCTPTPTTNAFSPSLLQKKLKKLEVPRTLYNHKMKKQLTVNFADTKTIASLKLTLKKKNCLPESAFIYFLLPILKSNSNLDRIPLLVWSCYRFFEVGQWIFFSFWW
jgi:hypothetical protein